MRSTASPALDGLARDGGGRTSDTLRMLGRARTGGRERTKLAADIRPGWSEAQGRTSR